MVEKNWLISKVLEVTGLDGARLLAEAGLGCVGCAMARGETLEEGCLAHGLNGKQISTLVVKLNALKE
ncbi:MAG: disulfide oxidoreductase [Candidatus Micrarchaeia archaeon]